MRFVSVLVLVAGMLVIGCGGEKDSAESGIGNSSAVVSGKPASEFFSQFLAKKYRYIDVEEGDRGVYFSAVVFEIDAIASRNGNLVFADGVLYLNANGSYRFVYREYEKVNRVNQYFAIKTVNGNYKAVGTKLQLQGLGEVSGGTYNDYQALTVSFTADIVSAGLSGQSSIGLRYVSRRSPQEEANSDLPTSQSNFEDLKEHGTFNKLAQ
jgi:hypothetical protein